MGWTFPGGSGGTAFLSPAKDSLERFNHTQDISGAGTFTLFTIPAGKRRIFYAYSATREGGGNGSVNFFFTRDGLDFQLSGTISVNVDSQLSKDAVVFVLEPGDVVKVTDLGGNTNMRLYCQGFEWDLADTSGNFTVFTGTASATGDLDLGSSDTDTMSANNPFSDLVSETTKPSSLSAIRNASGASTVSAHVTGSAEATGILTRVSSSVAVSSSSPTQFATNSAAFSVPSGEHLKIDVESFTTTKVLVSAIFSKD